MQICPSTAVKQPQDLYDTQADIPSVSEMNGIVFSTSKIVLIRQKTEVKNFHNSNTFFLDRICSKNKN